MDKDKIIQSLLKLLQKNNSEIINLNIHVEKKEDEKENIRTVRADKPN